MDKMTLDEFEAGYSSRSGMSVERLHLLGLHGSPCDCGEDDCQGWQMVHGPTEPLVTPDGLRSQAKAFRVYQYFEAFADAWEAERTDTSKILLSLRNENANLRQRLELVEQAYGDIGGPALPLEEKFCTCIENPQDERYLLLDNECPVHALEEET